MSIKIALENNFKVTKEPLLKMALDSIVELETYNAKLLNSDIEKHNKIVELEAQIEKMECCENCIRYKPCITCNETIGNDCDYYSGGNVCNKWQLN